jgi:hypothetical protein
VWKLLQPLHVPVPMTKKWINIAKSFYEICQMRKCIGSIDGKYYRTKCPPKAGSQFCNYKSFHSVVLLAVDYVDCNFVLIDVGGDMVEIMTAFFFSNFPWERRLMQIN